MSAPITHATFNAAVKVGTGPSSHHLTQQQGYRFEISDSEQFLHVSREDQKVMAVVPMSNVTFLWQEKAESKAKK